LKIWDLETGKCMHTIQEKEYVTSLAAKGDLLFSGSMDKNIRVWNMETYECKEILKAHTGNVHCLVSAHDTLYSGSWDKTIKIWQ